MTQGPSLCLCHLCMVLGSQTSTDLLEDLVDVDLVGLDGLGLLLAGPRGRLLHNLLGCRCLGGRGLDSLLSDFGSHCGCLVARVRIASGGSIGDDRFCEFQTHD